LDVKELGDNLLIFKRIGC